MGYKKMLVIKAIESMVPPESARLASSATWAVKCQPPKLIDVFWHCHMMKPVKYLQDCAILRGSAVPGVDSLVDHDPGYINTSADHATKYPAKAERVFQYEQRWREESDDQHWRVADSDFFFEAHTELSEA